MTDNPNQEIEFLKQTELNWNKAIQDNLVEEMGQYMDEEWIIFSGDGNITTKEKFLQVVKSGDLKHSKMDFEILQVKIHEDTGLVMQRGTSAGTWQGHPFDNYEIASTVFVRKEDQWLAVQTMIAPAVRQNAG
jgi:ketosteroid isomerase-like protein